MKPIISRKLLRPEALLTCIAALFQIKHWSLESHGLRLRGDTSDYVTTIVFDNWYAPFAVTALLCAAAFRLARRFPEWSAMPYVSFITVLVMPLLAYKLAAVYRITYFAGNPSFFLAGLGMYKFLLHAMLALAFGAFLLGQVFYIAKFVVLFYKNVKVGA